MIAFLPVVRLRELGKQIELKRFSEAVLEREFTSVETLIAGVFYRFACDKNCPAIFVLVPKAGFEPFEGIEYVEDMDVARLKWIANEMFTESKANYGTDQIDLYPVRNDTVLMYVKKDFKKGEWSNYGFELSGKDGISIPSE